MAASGLFGVRSYPTREERFAAEVIRRLSTWDCASADAETGGAIVWWLLDGGQRVGGVEVTIVGDPKAFQASSEAGSVYWELPAAQWTWMLNYTPRTVFKEVRRHLEPLVLLCEEHGVVEPEQLPWAVSRDSPAVRWYIERSGCSLHGFPGASRHGVVDVVPTPHDEGLRTVPLRVRQQRAVDGGARMQPFFGAGLREEGEGK